MLLEPGSKKVAMIALPRRGFVGLNPFMIAVPPGLSVLFC